MCIVSLERNKTVIHEVHTELRIASSTVQLMFVLKVETALPLMEKFGLHSYCRSVALGRFKRPCLMGHKTPVFIRESRV